MGQVRELSRERRTERAGTLMQAALGIATLGPWLAVLAGTPASWLLLLSTPHVATTVVLYADREMWPVLRSNLTRFVLAPIGIALAGITMFGFGAGPVLTAAAVGLSCWQLHHFTRQNVGVFSFWCRARRVSGPSVLERRLVATTGYAAMLGVLRIVQPGAFADATAGIGRTVLILAAVIFCWHVVMHRIEPSRAGALGMLIMFYAPLFTRVTLTQAVAAYGAAHGAQYYVMMFGLSGGRTRAARRVVLAEVTASAVLLGLPLYELGQLGADAGWPFGIYSAVVAWHFVTDAGAWKLRLPAQRSYMQRRFSFL